MSEVTPSQHRVRESYIKHQSIKATSKELNMNLSSVVKNLGRCAINMGVFKAKYSNPYKLDNMVSDRMTTHVRFDENGSEVKNVWYKDKAGVLNHEQIIEVLTDRVPAFDKKIIKPKKAKKDTLLKIVLADMHIGMLAWKAETNDSDYDLKIAKDLYVSAIKETLKRSGKVEHIVLELLGDTLHTDGIMALTPESKHVLDVDSRFDKILSAAVDIICSVIELCAEYSKELTVFCIRGNHDSSGAIGLRHILNAYYRNKKSINIDMSPAKNRTFVFGSSAFMFSHGDKTKPERLAGELNHYLFENNYTGIRDRYVEQGHLHTYQIKDISGVECRTMPTIIPKDSHAANCAFLSKKALIAEVFEKQKGLMSSFVVTPRQIGF